MSARSDISIRNVVRLQLEFGRQKISTHLAVRVSNTSDLDMLQERPWPIRNKREDLLYENAVHRPRKNRLTLVVRVFPTSLFVVAVALLEVQVVERFSNRGNEACA
jgi:hypothetical protein